MHIVALDIDCCKMANLKKATGTFTFPSRPSGRFPTSADPWSIWLEHFPREWALSITETQGTRIHVSGPSWQLKGLAHVVQITKNPCKDPKVPIGQPSVGSFSCQGSRREPRRHGMNSGS